MKHSLPPALQPWISDSGSFMQRARRFCLNPEIKVLRQEWRYPDENERTLLQLKPRRYVFSREVLIHHHNLALLFAQTVISAEMLSGAERQLRYLGTKALGTILFAYPDLQRSAFEVSSYQLPEYSLQPLWGRRSIFYFREKQLLLSEVFLPGLVDLL